MSHETILPEKPLPRQPNLPKGARWPCVVGAFPDGRSALMLAAARLRYVSGTRWGTRRYMDMDRLKEMKETESSTADKKIA